MRLVTTGGRDYYDRYIVWGILDKLRPVAVAVGCASGADECVREYCKLREVAYRVFRAQWDVHGRGAGPMRNREMLVEFEPDLVLAFPGGRGTTNCVEQAKSLGIIVLGVV